MSKNTLDQHLTILKSDNKNSDNQTSSVLIPTFNLSQLSKYASRCQNVIGFTPGLLILTTKFVTSESQKIFNLIFGVFLSEKFLAGFLCTAWKISLEIHQLITFGQTQPWWLGGRGVN